MLGAILEGSGIGQYVAPDPSVPNDNENDSSLMQMIAPDPNYYASKNTNNNNSMITPKKKRSTQSSSSTTATPTMKICTPSRTSILSANKRQLLHTPNTNNKPRSSPASQELRNAVLLAAEDTTKLLSSPTPIWSKTNDLFLLCTKTKPLTEKQQNKFRSVLKNNPSLCQTTRSTKTMVPDGYTLLHAAASSNNIIAATIILDMKKIEIDSETGEEKELQLVSVLTPDLQGRTALHIACEYGHKSMIRLLNAHLAKEIGALPVGENAPVDLIGYTPLACAMTSRSNKQSNAKEIAHDLFSPGDKSIYPKNSIEPRSSVKTDNIKYGYSILPGWRVTMEDSTCCATHLNDAICNSFFGVFDGHADNAVVSTYLSDNIVPEFLKQRENENTNENNVKSIGSALINTCIELDKQLYNGTFMPSKECGSTAIMSIILNKYVVVGNVGDSRAIIIQEETDEENENMQPKVIEVSKDHKPNMPLEKERIEKAGLSVMEEKTSETNIIYKIQNNNNKLATSRSFGDFDFKANTKLSSNEQAVTAVPDIYIHERDSKKDKFILLASDGVWDVMSNEDVSTFVLQQYANATKENNDDNLLAHIGDELIHECFQKRGSSDNMSVIIVSLMKNKGFNYYNEEDDKDCVEEITETVKRLDFSSTNTTGDES